MKNLQTICIRSITENFDRFCAAHSLEENDSLQYYFEFLQSKYSREILKNLADDKAVRNEHLKFVINKYTKELDFRIFYGTCDYTLVIERLKDVGSALLKFTLSGERSWLTVNNILSCLTSVEILELNNTKCSDDSLKIIAENCLKIRSLNLFGCNRVTDVGLAILCGCATLQSLNVEETSVSHKGVAKVLRQVPLLQHLQYENVSQAIFEAIGLNSAIRENEMDYRGKFNLTNIAIYNNPMRPENHLTLVLKVCTTFCPKIKDLLITDLVSEEQLSLCSLFKNLEIVTIGCSFLAENKCTNDFISLRGGNLRTLRLTSFSVNVQMLAYYCSNLECLSLESPSFQPFSNAYGNNFSFPCLKSLNLKKISDDDDFVSFLISSSPNLEVLNFFGSQLSEVVCNAILASPAMFRVINFSSSVVDVIFLQQILRTHRTLNKLIIESTNITTPQYDVLLDMADDLNIDVDIVWTDFSEIVRNLFSDFNNGHRQVIKL